MAPQPPLASIIAMSADMPTDAEEIPPLDPVTDAEGFQDIDEGEEIVPLHYGISSYGADFPVDGLVKRMDNGDIVVPTFDPEVDGSVTDMAGFQNRRRTDLLSLFS